MTPPLELHPSRFLLLLALHLGERLDVDDGVLTLSVPGEESAAAIPSLPAALDDLEARGWVVIAGDTPVLTDAARYWLDRWLRRAVGVKNLLGSRGLKLRAVRT